MHLDFKYRGRFFVVQRKLLENGKAMKIIMEQGLEESLDVRWLARSAIIQCRHQSGGREVIAAHWAHKDKWFDSLDEVITEIGSLTVPSVLLADLNVEKRSSHQTLEERSRWAQLEASMTGLGNYEIRTGLSFTKLPDEEGNRDSYLDHVFVSRKLPI